MSVADWEIMDREALLAAIRSLELEYRDLQVSYDIIMEHNSTLENELYSRNCALERGIIVKSSELEASREQNEKTRQHLIVSEKLAKLGELVAGMTHELNTPLGVAVTAASYQQNLIVRLNLSLAKQGESGMLSIPLSIQEELAGLAESAEMVAANLRRAVEIVSSFKQMAVDQSSDKPRYFDLADVLQKTINSLKPQLRGTAFTVGLDCPPHLMMHSYPGTLAQIVTNLVMNSLVHGFRGRTKGRMNLSAVLACNDQLTEVVLHFQDDGNGIAPEDLPRIFDQFFTTRSDEGGSGLGLSIVKSLITDRLGGKISCSSQTATTDQAGWTVFEIRLPVRVKA